MASRADRCQLYLIVCTDRPDGAARDLEAALAVTPVACVLIAPLPADGPIAEAAARRLVPLAQRYGAAALLADDAVLARNLGADGVHLTLAGEASGEPAKALTLARATVGKGQIVGATVGWTRHRAMEVGEAGADYVAFAAPVADPDALAARRDQVAWWGETFVVPGVAWNVGDVADARDLARAGADFVAVADAAWRGGRTCGGPEGAVRAFAAALDLDD